MNYTEMKLQARNYCLKSKAKNYIHFDKPLTAAAKKKLLRKLDSDTYVRTFRHLPFITFNINFKKYGYLDKVNPKKGLHNKSRMISLASHHDALLFSYYGRILSMCYQKYVTNTDIDKIAVAYRPGKSNVTGAKEVFDYLWRTGDSWIIKGDFSSFFDNLNHQILFKNTKQILKTYCNGKIPKDWQAVLNAVTKYRSISKGDLKSLQVSEGRYKGGMGVISELSRANQLKVSGPNKKGIPQGTSISSVLANVYMLEFDGCVEELIKPYGGLYRRYSDDFAIILPAAGCSEENIRNIQDKVKAVCRSKVLLEIESSKSKLLRYNRAQGAIYFENTHKRFNFDFLGFSFTGRKVILRPRTIYKFRYKGRHAVYLLKRNMNERDIALSTQYEIHKKEYLAHRAPSKQNQVAKRLDSVRRDAQRGYALRSRKKVTVMYLVNKPLFHQNMRSYAKMAQQKMSVKIEGTDSLYQVKIEKPIVKQIGYFQRLFGETRYKRPYRGL
jgi:hypothetical protein